MDHGQQIVHRLLRLPEERPRDDVLINCSCLGELAPALVGVEAGVGSCCDMALRGWMPCPIALRTTMMEGSEGL